MSAKHAGLRAFLLLTGRLSLTPCLAQTGSEAAARTALRTEMAHIALVTHGPVGAAVCIVEGGSAVALRGEQRFPMQSVYKLPIGLALLHQVDLGKLTLIQTIRLRYASR